MIRRRGGDTTVASLLRSLPVPEHSDDFFERLRAQLHDEDTNLAGPPSAVIDLSVRRTAQRPQRRGQRIVRLATAPAAAVACFALVVGGGLLARRTGDDTKRPDSSAPVATGDSTSPKAQRLVVPAAYAPAVTGLHVKFRTYTDDAKRARAEYQYDAVISPTGDYHVSRVSPRLELNSSAQADSRTKYHEEKGKAPEVLTESGLALGPPDGPGVSDPMRTLSRDLGAAVRAIAAERPDEVRHVQRLGRPALELDEEGRGGSYLQSQSLVVDAKTGIALEIRQTRADGTTVHTLVVDELDDNQPLGDAVLRPALPQSPNTAIEQIGFTPTTLAGAATAAGYQPLVPGWAPPGFALAKVAVASSVTPEEGHPNPVAADVVELLYRNGFDSFTVSTRHAAAWSANTTWTDPLLPGDTLPDLTTPDRVKEGALAGTDLHVGIYPLVWPHVWAQQGDLVVTVAGDLTREQLLAITKSLRAYQPQ